MSLSQFSSVPILYTPTPSSEQKTGIINMETIDKNASTSASENRNFRMHPAKGKSDWNAPVSYFKAWFQE